MQGERRLAIAASIVAALAVAMAGFYPGNNPDTFGHLAQGRQIVALGRVPLVDTLSLLPGPPRPWHNYEWLSDLGTYLLYEHAGYASITVFKCGLLVLTVLALAGFAALVGGPRAAVFTSLVVVSSIPAIRLRLSDRPHVLGICFAAFYLLLLTMLTRTTAARTRMGIVAIIGTMHVIWVNAHGSHLLGLGITISFLLWVHTAFRPLAWTLLIQLAACCVSPYGPAIVLDAFAHVFDPRYRQLVTEWQPWREVDPVWMQLGPVLQAAVLTVLAPRIMRPSPALRASVMVALVLGIACFRSIRFVAEFMLTSAPMVGVGLSTACGSLSFPRFAAITAGLAAILGAVVPFGIIRIPPPLGFGARMSLVALPEASTAMLARDGRAPRVLASMQDSWFTLFATPSAKVVVDGRVPFFGVEHIMLVSSAFGSEQAFREVTRAFDVNTVIAAFAFSDDGALAQFAPRQGFSLRLVEDLHALYTRDDVFPRELAPPLRALQPSYSTDWILVADAARRATIAEELQRIAAHPGTSSYVAWVRAVSLLADLRRGKNSDGFRWPRSEADWQRYRSALPLLTEASRIAGNVPAVSALQGYVAAVLCEFDVAEKAIAVALSERPSREPLLATQELLLRQGRTAEVREIVSQAKRMPDAKDDAWLEELARGLENAPHCPTKSF